MVEQRGSGFGGPFRALRHLVRNGRPWELVIRGNASRWLSPLWSCEGLQSVRVCASSGGGALGCFAGHHPGVRRLAVSFPAALPYHTQCAYLNALLPWLEGTTDLRELHLDLASLDDEAALSSVCTALRRLPRHVALHLRLAACAVVGDPPPRPLRCLMHDRSVVSGVPDSLFIDVAGPTTRGGKRRRTGLEGLQAGYPGVHVVQRT